MASQPPTPIQTTQGVHSNKSVYFSTRELAYRSIQFVAIVSQLSMATIGDVIASKWTIIRILGEGAFGRVYLASANNDQQVVIKLELPVQDHRFSLRLEYKTLCQIHAYANSSKQFSSKPIPLVHPIYLGTHKKQNVMVTTPLGVSLDIYQNRNNGHFKYLAVYQTAFHLLTALQITHQVGFVHMDIKPDNIIAGTSKSNNSIIFLNDFGLASFYLNSRTNQFLPQGPSSSFKAGTALFGPLKAMYNQTCGPTDDLESLGYTLIHMIKGCLPWYNKSYSTARELKNVDKRAEICKHLPIIRKFFELVDEIQWGQMPDYERLSSMFHKEIRKLNGNVTDLIDWGAPQNSNEGILDNNRCKKRHLPHGLPKV